MYATADAQSIEVALSYDNVRQLYDAMEHMRTHPSHNVFTLTKLQDDGITVRVAVCKEYNDWERR